MEIKIGEKVYTLHFGWGFLKYVNKHHSVAIEGVSTGSGGMTILSAGVGMRDPEALEIIIKAGTDTENSKPTTEEVQTFIDQLINEDRYFGFFDEVEQEIKKASVLSLAMKGLNGR